MVNHSYAEPDFYTVTATSVSLESIEVATVATTSGRMGSEQTDPRKAHQTTIFSWKGFRMTPSNTSELVS
jgi:hypothetical protein